MASKRLLTSMISRALGGPQVRSYHTMKAVVMAGAEARLQTNRPLPKLRDDYILVKPAAIALNPTDWKHIAFRRAKDGALVGCDYAGTVIEVGKGVTKSWTVGERICGCAHGSNLVNPEDGAFAEYAVVKGDIQMRIPDEWSFEKAATIGLGATTVGQGLYQKALKLNLPTDPVREALPVLIYGGGTATGALAIQYARLSGYTVVTTADPDQFDYVRELGAQFVIDYRDPLVGRKIREYTENRLKYAWDTIGLESSAAICADALTTESGGRYGATNPVNFPRRDVDAKSVNMYTVFGEYFDFGGKEFAASQEDFEFSKKFMALTESLLAKGVLKPHKQVVKEGGLQGVIQGLIDLKDGKVSGKKLVYRVSETP